MMETNLSDEDKKNRIEIWKNIVNVQMHFNEIEMKIRQLTLTLFTFLVAGIGYTIKESAFIMFFGCMIPLGVVIGVFGSLVIYGLYLMDRHWYHRLLHGAVGPAVSAEASLKQTYPEMNLSTSIKETSPSKIFFGLLNLHSDGKLRFFYYLLLFPLLIFSMTLFFNQENIDITRQYNFIKKNSVRVSLGSDIVSAPNKAGIVLLFTKDNRLLSAVEAKNIKLHLSRIFENETLANHNIYYSVVQSNRKEIEDMINECGIEIVSSK